MGSRLSELPVQADLVDAEQVVLTHHHEDHVGNAGFAANHLDRPPLAHGLTLPLVRRPLPLPLYRRVTWGVPEPFEAETLGETPNAVSLRYNRLLTRLRRQLTGTILDEF